MCLLFTLLLILPPAIGQIWPRVRLESVADLVAKEVRPDLTELHYHAEALIGVVEILTEEPVSHAMAGQLAKFLFTIKGLGVYTEPVWWLWHWPNPAKPVIWMTPPWRGACEVRLARDWFPKHKYTFER